MKLAEKIRLRARNDFSGRLAAAFMEKFGIEIETSFAIISFRHVTRRKDGRAFTKEQHAFIAGFEVGYFSAVEVVK